MKILLALLLAVWSLAGPLSAAPDEPLHLPQAKIADVLATYSRLIGKPVIADNTVQGQIDLVIEHPLSAEAGAALIEKSLFLNGLTLFDTADGTVIVLGLGKSVRNAGVPVYTNPAEFPKGERVFTYLYKAQHLQPLELSGVLQQYIPPSNMTAFTPAPKSGVLMVTAPTSIVRSILQVLAAVDIAPVGIGSPSTDKADEDAAKRKVTEPAARDQKREEMPYILR